MSTRGIQAQRPASAHGLNLLRMRSACRGWSTTVSPDRDLSKPFRSGVREAHKDVNDIQLACVAARGGILTSAGTPESCRRRPGGGERRAPISSAASIPASSTAMGETPRRGVRRRAQNAAADVDIHLHDPGNAGILEIEQIADRTRALGMAGHVAISHAYALGAAPDDTERTADTLAASGTAIMTNAPGSRPFRPSRCWAAGVTVLGGNDNIRDLGGPRRRRHAAPAHTIGYRPGFNTDEDLAIAFDMVTRAGAGAAPRRLRFACRRQGDFVTLNVEHAPEAVSRRRGDRCSGAASSWRGWETGAGRERRDTFHARHRRRISAAYPPSYVSKATCVGGLCSANPPLRVALVDWLAAGPPDEIGSCIGTTDAVSAKAGGETALQLAIGSCGKKECLHSRGDNP